MIALGTAVAEGAFRLCEFIVVWRVTRRKLQTPGTAKEHKNTYNQPRRPWSGVVSVSVIISGVLRCWWPLVLVPASFWADSICSV